MESKTKRSRNNEARMKNYNKKKEEQTWYHYEKFVINYHTSKYNQGTWIHPDLGIQLAQWYNC